MALLLPCSEAATGSDEAFGRRLLFRRSELLGRPTLSFPLYQAFDVERHTSCTFTDGCFWHWDLLLIPSYTGWSLLFLTLASLISLPKEPASAATRAPSALDVPGSRLDHYYSLVISAYHSVHVFSFGLNQYILISGSPPPKQLAPPGGLPAMRVQY